MDLMMTLPYLNTLAGLGVTIPERADVARTIYEQAAAAVSRNPSDELVKALTTGDLTPENVGERVWQSALDMTAQQNAGNIVRNLAVPLNRVIREALREDYPRIHAELRATFDAAAVAVTKAAQHFDASTTAEDVVRMKPDVVKQWNQVTAHTTTLEVVGKAYRHLVSDVMRNLPDTIVSLFVTGDEIDVDQAAELYRSGRAHEWLALASAGFTLNLNTLGEAATVVASHNSRVAARLAAEKEALRQKHVRRYMPIGMR